MQWATGWPDFGDHGKQVEIQLEDGTVIAGSLEAVDFSPPEDPGDIPFFMVVSNNGTQHQFEIHRHWRFVPPNRVAM